MFNPHWFRQRLGAVRQQVITWAMLTQFYVAIGRYHANIS